MAETVDEVVAMKASVGHASGTADNLPGDSWDVKATHPVRAAGRGQHAFLALGDRTEELPAICIGLEHGTVGPLLIKEAAKEAV